MAPKARTGLFWATLFLASAGLLWWFPEAFFAAISLGIEHWWPLL